MQEAGCDEETVRFKRNSSAATNKSSSRRALASMGKAAGAAKIKRAFLTWIKRFLNWSGRVPPARKPDALFVFGNCGTRQIFLPAFRGAAVFVRAVGLKTRSSIRAGSRIHDVGARDGVKAPLALCTIGHSARPVRVLRQNHGTDDSLAARHGFLCRRSAPGGEAGSCARDGGENPAVGVGIGEFRIDQGQCATRPRQIARHPGLMKFSNSGSLGRERQRFMRTMGPARARPLCDVVRWV